MPRVTGVRFYKGPDNTGTHVGSLYTATGTLLESGTFTGETASGWQTLNFTTPVNVDSNTTYVVTYFAPNGHYSATPGYFGNNTASFNQLHAIADGVDGGNGVYMYGAASTFPTNTYNANNYWVDVLWQQGANGDTTPPSVTAVSPADGASGAALTTHLTATFSEAVDLGSANFTVTDPGGAALTGTTTLSADQQTLTFTPSAPLSPGTTYQGSVKVADVNGNTMSAPSTFTFTTTTAVTCPCTLFSAATVPTVVNTNDPNPYELGVKFSPASDGTITGVKFYKGSKDTGTHTGNLYTATGTLLATGTFAGESASGWQTLTFASPVSVTAGTTYVASYTTTTGFYSGDNGYFNRTGVTTPKLSAPQNVAGNPNGVFTPGSGFPTDSFGGSNYWVDVVFTD
jgi:methionine-rich copper-binding protein CopC